MSIEIRPAHADDLPGLRDLYRQLYPEADVRDEADAADAEGSWRAIEQVPGRQVLVADHRGQVVGSVDLTVVPNLPQHGRPFLVIHNVVVDAANRRLGIGRRLMGAAEELARRTGGYKLELSADDPDAFAFYAFAFYEALGLQPTARTYKRYLDGSAGGPAADDRPSCNVRRHRGETETGSTRKGARDRRSATLRLWLASVTS